MFTTNTIHITPEILACSPNWMSSRAHAFLSTHILTIAREHERVTLTSAEAGTKANRQTIRVHIRKLIAAGQLVQHGAGRGTWYSPTIQIP